MKWQNILKTGIDFQRFLIEIFGIPRAEARELLPSISLQLAIEGKLTEFINENEFETLINLAESKQYETFIRTLEEINSRYQEFKEKRKRARDSQKRKERYANDPEYAEKIKRENREAYRRRKERKE